jgi:hypothetical protein
MLDPLYSPYPEEVETFGAHWIGPAKYSHSEPVLIATYAKNPKDGDGQTVEIYCEAHPARFYCAKVLPGANSIGAIKRGCEIRTGSGMDSARLIADIAEAISTGMLGVYPAKD